MPNVPLKILLNWLFYWSKVRTGWHHWFQWGNAHAYKRGVENFLFLVLESNPQYLCDGKWERRPLEVRFNHSDIDKSWIFKWSFLTFWEESMRKHTILANEVFIEVDCLVGLNCNFLFLLLVGGLISFAFLYLFVSAEWRLACKEPGLVFLSLDLYFYYWIESIIRTNTWKRLLNFEQ